ncbi:uncharacterized protein LOC102711048 [Oryza brachyantha]|uniref:Uncharacterized protein n=1 Tax=Oryza brachyantha TaxID=4533 RepID=J3LHC1_ORYBR|nr:uncharacterized protein LOC102711048 [Oryza brachyantha]
MELTTLPASPPQDDFRFDGPMFTAFPEAAPEAGTNPFASTDAMGDSNPFLATAVTAPPSPNPFELHQSASPGIVSGAADPFDLFQHFTSAPASPARAAAIYAQFDSSVGDGSGPDKDRAVVDDDDDFQPRASYSTAASTVPFDWEEKPGKPKTELACAAASAANGEVDDADFDFGVLLDKNVQVAELTTADELFDEGKIRPLKPPPGLLDGGSVASSPRSPISKSSMWSPRLRGLVGSGADFDPFAAALAKAAKGPSPLGAGAKDAADAGTASSPRKPDPVSVSVTSPRSIPPVTMINGGRKKWRLSDMLLFRRSAAKARATGNISKEPVFKYSPVQQLGSGTPVKKATAAEPVAANGDVSAGKHKKQSKKVAAAVEDGMASPHRHSVMGCAGLNPGLHRLAKGFNGSSLHFGHRRTARRPVSDEQVKIHGG